MLREEACILTTTRPWAESRKIERLLAFFGSSARTLPVGDFWTEAKSQQDTTGYRLFSSANGLLELLDLIELDNAKELCWVDRVHSVFVQGDLMDGATGELVRVLTGGKDCHVEETADGSIEWEVTTAIDDFGGHMRGLRIAPRSRPGKMRRGIDVSEAAGSPLISSGRNSVFFMLRWRNVPIFVCLADEIIDLDGTLTTPNFDVRDHFFAAVPVVSYLRWAFPDTLWRPVDLGGCIIIDDPLLRPRYGFVRFRSLLELMERHDFSSNIAFIPWNWKRSDSDTASLFKSNPGRLSLSIHGCDHTAGEFGNTSSEQLRSLIATALERMEAHEKLTGLTHGQIMVFPQGIFSEPAMRELKQANFVAAVNTEVICAGESGQVLRISDVWDVAVRRYADFPLYTRRYPGQSVENFAFDLQLGKPCLIVIHHDDCRNNCHDLMKFVERLNALRPRIVWRNLGDVLRRSYRRRTIDLSVEEIEMYAAEIVIENVSPNAKTFRVKRREAEPMSVAEVHCGSQSIRWDVVTNYLHFEVVLPPGGSTTVRIRHASPQGSEQNGRAHSGFKTALRRFLCEMRDNYVVPAKDRLGFFSQSP